MKKIKILFLLLMCTMLSFTQTNLIVNPSFETWTAGNPDGWTIPANSTHAGSLTWTQESTIKSNGLSSLKLVIGTTQNPGFQQVVPITAGKTYTVKMDYYVVSGDATDVRIWSSFKNSTGFYAAANWTTAIAADANIQKKLQGSGSDIAAYFTITNGVWGTYTVDFVAPSDATDFVFECRSYKSSTVIWDNMFFGEIFTDGLNEVSNKLDFRLIGKQIFIDDYNQNSNLNIFTTSGVKVFTYKLVNGSVNVKNLLNGLYIITYNNKTSKLIIKD